MPISTCDLDVCKLLVQHGSKLIPINEGLVAFLVKQRTCIQNCHLINWWQFAIANLHDIIHTQIAKRILVVTFWLRVPIQWALFSP